MTGHSRRLGEQSSSAQRGRWASPLTMVWTVWSPQRSRKNATVDARSFAHIYLVGRSLLVSHHRGALIRIGSFGPSRLIGSRSVKRHPHIEEQA